MAAWQSASYDGRYLQLTITETVNVAANTSTLNWTLTSTGGSASYYTVDTTTVTINGTQVYYKARTAWDDRVFPAAKGSVSGTISVAHDSNGTKSINVGFSTRVYVYGPQEYGGTMVLSNIDRTAPTVSFSVSNITAGGFKISATSSATSDVWQYSTNNGTSWTQFSTTSGTTASYTLTGLSPNTSYNVKVRARKKSNQVYGTSGSTSVKTLGGAVVNSVTNVTADAAAVSFVLNVTVYEASYTNTVILKNGSTTYLTISGLSWSKGTANRTVTLTADQRTSLLTSMASIKSFTGTFEVTTFNGTTQVGSASSKTATVTTTPANSGPVLSGFTYEDSYSTTYNITGNNQLFIQGYSTLKVTPGTATAYNGASITNYTATCNGVSASNTTGAAISVGKVTKSGNVSVVLTVTDSRGYTASVTKTISVLAYAKPKVSALTLRRTNDIESEMQLSFNGSISPITVSSTQKNALLYVRYQYKLTSDTSYGSYVSILPSVTQNGTSYSYSNVELCSLDSNSSYDFHLQIRDKLNSLTSIDLYYVVPQGTPLLALRKGKVGINTPAPEAALHVVGDVKISGGVTVGGTLTAATLSGSLAPSKLSSAVPISKGGTGATTAAAAATNIVGSQNISPLSIIIGANRYKQDDLYGIDMKNSDIVGANGLFFGDAADSAGEGLNFYRSTGYYDRLYAYAGTLYFAPNCSEDTHPGTRYTVYHSGGATIPISKGGTGGTTAATARANLGIACTSLYSGALSSGSCTFNYGNYNAYIIAGQPSSSASKMSLIIPKGMITTSDVNWQIADEVNYRGFKLKYSGTTTTLTIGNGSGSITNVYGIN
jgi:hypothetical protein|nr:MAG TPA: protein of unknown function DUF859 [Caudoviricetes sp.]